MKIAALSGDQKDILRARLTPRLNKYIPHDPLTPGMENYRQAAFLLLDVEEAFYGGSAGSGKSDALLIGALQEAETPGYAALLLRRSYQDLALPSALMDRSHEWLQPTDAHWDGSTFTWKFPNPATRTGAGGATITFGYLAAERDKYRYQCFSPDTEILTLDGWRAINEANVGDEVATVDPVGRRMEYQPIARTWAYDFQGDLVEINQRNGVSMSVTPNHSLWASTAKLDRLRKFDADSFTDGNQRRIPQSVEWEGTDPGTWKFQSDGHRGRLCTFSADEWAELLGWYVAEGSTDVGRWAVVLSQVKTLGRSKIRDLLRSTGVNFHEDPRRFSFNNKAVVQHLRLHCGGRASQKRLPAYVRSWDRRRSFLLMEALIDGDGSWSPDRNKEGNRRGHFVTASPQLADEFCEVALRAGWRPTLNVRKADWSSFGTTGAEVMYHVAVSKRKHDTIVKGWKRRSYSGPVYCVSVPPHGTVVTRHNGRVSVSGNSAEFHYIGFDELTQFAETQYLYLFSRLRRLIGSPFVLKMRSASNPGGLGHEWVFERFVKPMKDYLEGRGPKPDRVFIPATMADNPWIEQDYAQMLDKLDYVTREQLKHGDWFIQQEGNMFRKDWFPMYDLEWKPDKPKARVRMWDLAASEKKSQKDDPDWTVGALVSLDRQDQFWIEDIVRIRETPAKVDETVKNTASQDGRQVWVGIEQEPGASGKRTISDMRRRLLRGYVVRPFPARDDKVERARLFSAKAEGGDVNVIRAPWNDALFGELVQFPNPNVHDDQVDAISAAIHLLSGPRPTTRGKVRDQRLRGRR